MITLAAVLLGAVVGSFLNVVITRLPRGESLIRPASHCPRCGHPIRWHDNVPILSFIWLRGRCRDCRAPIPWRYPAVEAATAGLFGVTAWRIGLQVDLIPTWLFLGALVAITGIDIEYQLIPDRITLPGIVLGVLVNLVTGHVTLAQSLLGILVGGGTFFVVIVVSRGGMGGGDMKLGAMIGAFLGWKLVILTIFFSVFLGGGIATVLLVSGIRRRKDPVPFGPFLAIGSTVALFWGNEVLRWYLRGFGN
ncbi:MAG: prepilin peptidase [Candidatus Rokubacteria bacterium]|nr:prepilin peptidase [Candidatus Rokubacteria bacterium]